MDKHRKPELLSPVRDQTSFIAAMEAGADAVYFGLGTLNMRVRSKGIDVQMLPEIVRQAHSRNIKVYIALNVIVYNEELEIVDKLLTQIKQAGVDAVICSDFAVIRKCAEQGIDIHISTQANISNIEAVKFFASIGAKRVVLARELWLEQVRQIKQQSPIEIETFVHGAMCISVSGRCFMSHYAFGESANRGQCWQPCRREYLITDTSEPENQLKIGCGYVLSPKDMCTIDIIDKLIKADIDCFKIEGRSRSPEYIKTITEVYRTAIDSYFDGKLDNGLKSGLFAKAKKVYNRDFSTGFYLGKPGSADFAAYEGSIATQRKIAVGRVLNYYPKPKAAYIIAQSATVSKGDMLHIEGPTTGIVEIQADSILDENGQAIDTVKKANFTISCPTKVRHNDKVYKIENIDEF